MKIKGLIADLKNFFNFYLKNDNSKNISRTFSGGVVDSVGSVHFQIIPSVQFSLVQSLSRVRLCATP